MRTAIIGGGIAGLAAAYELEQARASGAAVEYTLFPREGVSLERPDDRLAFTSAVEAFLAKVLGGRMQAAQVLPASHP